MLALLVWLIIAPAHALAQRDLAQLHDSLQRIADPSTLRDMIAHRAGRKVERNPELLTERGLIAMRLYELTSSRSDGKNAQKAFEQAIKQAPRYGWAHYGLGRVLAYGPDGNPWAGGLRNAFVLDDAIGRVFGNDSPSRARRAFMDAVNGDPPVTQAATELAAISTKRWSRETLERSKTALEELNATDRANADSWLALSRVQLELGLVDEAVTALEKSAARGIDRANGARTLAMILFQSDAREKHGADAWFEAVDHAGADVLELLLEDVSALLNKHEYERVQKLDADAQRRYLREFWDMRAALGGVTVHERMAEHYRRLAIARRQYWR
ncbi:MAG TPA: GWxTD domain-containing protein, partial [Longimicrobiales bacterium]